MGCLTHILSNTSVFHSQRRDACMTIMARRLAVAEEAVEELGLELEVKDGLLGQEDAREAALVEQ